MRHDSRPTPTVVTVGGRRAVAAVAALLAVLGGALVPTAVAAQQDTTNTNTDTADVRIVARKLESGRVEFGLQQRQADDSWGDRRLPGVRFFPTTARVGRWLASSPIDLPVGEVRIVARRLESGRVEFGLQQRQADDSWGDRRLPGVRFFPTTARVGRWLASSPVTVRGVSVADAGSGPVADGQPQQASGSYRDVRSDAPYAEAVAALAGAGVFAGTWCDDGFCPDDPIDRKTMAVWLVRLLDGEDPPRAAEPRIRDVDAAGFHAPFIERLADLDRVTGCRAAARLWARGSFAQFRTFGPDEDVTRAQAVAFIAGFYCFAWAVPEPDFSDVPPGAWYADVNRGANLAHAVAWGHFEGCDGGNRFCPDRTMTRAEMATALWRAEYPEHPQVPPAEQPQQVSVKLTGAMDGGGVISGGQDQTCALRYDQTVACWGLHYDFKVSYPPFRFQTVSAGAGAHSCGVRVDQTLACWGGANQFGYVDAPPSGRFTSVSAGGVHTCGIRIEGTIDCWWIGEYFRGVFDSGQADAPSGSFTAVSAGSSHTCGVRADQRVICWGENRQGQADAPSGSFTAVSTGQSHTCGLRSDGTIACWGGNDEGQADAPSGRFTAVSAGRRHSCGIRIDQTIACWGNSGTLADIRSGRIRNMTWHVSFVPSGRFIAVSAGLDVPCAIRVGGTVECWGFAPGGLRDPSSAVWGVPPVATDCAPQPVSGGRPGRPAGTQVASTGAVDAQGLLIPPAFVRWSDPCAGGRVDHYVVQWRRGYEDFAADRQRIVDATDTPTTYALRLRDRFIYAVRVTAVNSSGRTSSDELIIPTPANEVRATAETLVSTYGDRIPWLADVWTYMKHLRSEIYATYCGTERNFNRYSVSCVTFPGMSISHPYYGSVFHHILLHEMAHIYHSSLFGYASALSRPDRSPPAFGDPELEKSNAAALGAGLLYLLTTFPDCYAPELLADMPLFVMPTDDDDLYTGGGAYRWGECYRLANLSTQQWNSKVDQARGVARSVFVDQEIPRWFFDTYQRADGTWDLDAIRSALSDADQQLGTSDEKGIRAALRTFIPDL